MCTFECCKLVGYLQTTLTIEQCSASPAIAKPYCVFEVDVDLQGRVLRWFLVRKKFVSQQRKVQSLLRSL